MINNIYIIVSLILVLILLIILYVLFNTYKKTNENYSNANVSSLSPSNYNSTNCEPDSNEVQFPKAYNEFCNTQNTLEEVNLAQPKQLEPVLSLHTLPKLHSSKKLYAYNEYCDISQSSTTTNKPYAYNEYCMTQLIRRTPLETSDNSNNTYVSPLAILATPQNIYSTLLQRQFNTSYSETNDLIIYPSAPSAPSAPTSATTNVHTITTRPLGYGNINGWYSRAKSEYLLDNPITIYYEQMIINYAPDTWKSLLRFPNVDKLPNYGSWWKWTSELENINKVIDYLGNTLGKFETHFVAATPIINPLIWVIKQQPSNEPYYKIINTNLENMLLNKINTALPKANIVLTQEEWSSCNITTNIITLHYINVGSSQYRPFSPGTDNVNSETLAIIANDWKVGARGDITPNLTLRVEECGGVCLKYMTKNNRQRLYMVSDLGMGHTPVLYGSWFNSMSSDAKKQRLRNEIYASISHEYTHVFQNQLIEPLLNGIWFAEDNIQDERSPNAISRWWLECFATLLPFFMGFTFRGFDIRGKIVNAITNIKTSNTLTATEFSDRMMYVNPYGLVN